MLTIVCKVITAAEPIMVAGAMMQRVGQSKSVDRTWHVGQAFPLFNALGKGDGDVEVTEVQADGDEAAFVLRLCRNLPCTTNEVQCWFGDHAKFVAAALAACRHHLSSPQSGSVASEVSSAGTSA